MAKTEIQWTSTLVEVSKIKETPNNYKLFSEEGSARFQQSLKQFGLAGTVVLNKDLVLIDGNSRLKKAKEQGIKKIWASLPDRLLNKKQFSEMSALFDYAIAGNVDILRIKEELGTTDDFFKTWGFDLPKAALEKLAELEKNEAVINPTAARKIADEAKEIPTSRITLLFTKSEAEEYIKLAEALYAKFKVDNVTDLSLEVLRFLKKSLKLK